MRQARWNPQTFDMAEASSFVRLIPWLDGKGRCAGGSLQVSVRLPRLAGE